MLARWRQDVHARYGTTRAWARHLIWALLHRLGWFRPLQRIDWNRVERLVFVCKGNICRSPYAEARARSWGLIVTSCGLDAKPGLTPNSLACQVARSRGLGLDVMRTRTVEQLRIGRNDLLVAMEPRHARRLAEPVRLAGAQTTLLGLWKTPPQPLIADPYGLSRDFFASCFDAIDEAIEGISVQLHARPIQRSKR